MVCALGNLFEWARENILEPANGTLSDMPTWESRTFASFCQDETLLVPFDEFSADQLDYVRARTLCRALGGKMAMPSSLKDEQTRWTELFASYEPRHVLRYRRFYLPITDNERPGRWKNDITQKESEYFNWGTLEPNGGIAENCTVLRMWNPDEYPEEFE